MSSWLGGPSNFASRRYRWSTTLRGPTCSTPTRPGGWRRNCLRSNFGVAGGEIAFAPTSASRTGNARIRSPLRVTIARRPRPFQARRRVGLGPVSNGPNSMGKRSGLRITPLGQMNYESEDWPKNRIMRADSEQKISASAAWWSRERRFNVIFEVIRCRAAEVIVNAPSQEIARSEPQWVGRVRPAQDPGRLRYG
jgi:hypothetical protein